MSEQATKLSFPKTDIAHLVIDVPGRSANMLSSSLLAEIDRRLDEIAANEKIVGVILSSAKPNSFVVGADLKELSGMLDSGAKLNPDNKIAFFQQGKTLFQRLASINAVTVAMVHGACVGGGAELALWCDYRVCSSSPKTCFGFPEVNLGLIPAWGGTVRLPRMIGLLKSIDMISGGRTISAEEALQIGVANSVSDNDKLLDEAIALIGQQTESEEYIAQRKRLAEPIDVHQERLDEIANRLNRFEDSDIVSDSPAAETAVRLIAASVSQDIATALRMESETMSRLFGSEASRALMHLFFLQDRAKKDSGVDSGVRREKRMPRKIESVGIAGAGLMGQGIADANITSELSATLFDIDEELLTAANDSLSQNGDTKLLSTTTELNDFAECDLVIESIVENEAIKLEFLTHVESNISDDALLASNTSSISIDALSQSLQKPERFCGIHFAHPVAERALVEIVRGAKTSDQTVASAVAYGKQIGKIPIVVGDSPGFVLNRLLFPYVNESLVLMSEGALIHEIDAAAVEFGMHYGPISHFDRVGLDTAAYTGMTMYRSFSRRAAMTPILTRLVKKKRLGMKTGSGFYSYANESRIAQDDPSLHDIVGSYIQSPPHEISREEIRQRLFLPLLVEATMILDEGLVRYPGDIDLSLVFGLAFPKSKGGILFWADQIGPRKILEMLKPFEELGPRYEPTQLMRTMANGNTSYYQI